MLRSDLGALLPSMQPPMSNAAINTANEKRWRVVAANIPLAWFTYCISPYCCPADLHVMFGQVFEVLGGKKALRYKYSIISYEVNTNNEGVCVCRCGSGAPVQWASLNLPSRRIKVRRFSTGETPPCPCDQSASCSSRQSVLTAEEQKSYLFTKAVEGDGTWSSWSAAHTAASPCQTEILEPRGHFAPNF